jgi:hypothetical protein
LCAARVALLVAVALAGCKSQPSRAIFFPIDSLVSSQIRHLTTIRAGLFKEASLSGKTDTVHYTPVDTLAWIKELDVFRKLDIINKPVNKGSYRIKDGLIDSGSNLTVKAFESLKDLPVVYLRVYYQGNVKKPRRVEALYKEANLLYQSSRFLSMEFQQIENNMVLIAYEIRGGQKMVLGDSVSFHINGRILAD